jgi:hypothetical protein
MFVTINWRLKKLYFTSGVLGAFAEIIAVKGNAWQYGNEQLLGVPIWLPVLWGIAGVCFVLFI